MQRARLHGFSWGFGFFLANFGCMSMSGLLSTGEDQ